MITRPIFGRLGGRVENRPSERIARLGRLTVAGMLLVTATACRQDMHDQPRYEPLEASTFFADGMASRAPIQGTIARGQLREDSSLYEGKDAQGALLTALPMPIDRPLLERGRQRFDIFCSPCHGGQGDGRGMVARRGFKTPPSFHSDPLLSQPVGYYFDVMTNGFGVMSSYASQISVEDRWAIAAYIRALQLSQATPAADLDAADRQKLSGGAAEPTSEEAEEAEEADDAHSGGH